jgi:hypothetical protein
MKTKQQTNVSGKSPSVMKTKQQTNVSGKSPSDQRQADRTAANKRKRMRDLFTTQGKPDYTQRKQRTMQYHRDPCDIVEMFYLGTRATLH